MKIFKRKTVKILKVLIILFYKKNLSEKIAEIIFDLFFDNKKKDQKFMW